MVDGEPVLVPLTMPTRRGSFDTAGQRSAGGTPMALIEGLVVPIGTGQAARIVDMALADERIADALAEAAHDEGGFVARTTDGDRAVAIIAATAAALCGEDIRTALVTPDIPFLIGLSGEAMAAVRDVLRAIESDTPLEVEKVLRARLGI
ncbi:hypothetical protein [Nocardia paucivorans]|uniref:hypothetical protein n=1 Tax=Nocardia paucivorans TaxID=114259 RepID=UPI0002EFA563|nr:hypothetical protein [Nocardia paucivorans]